MNLKCYLGLLFFISLSSQAAVKVSVKTADGQPLSGAVVMLQGQPITPPEPLTAQQIIQKNKRFLPDVLVVTTGTEVYFPNQDTVRHHVYSFSAAKTFEIKLYVGTPAEPVVFDQPGIAVLGCNIHDEMIAWVVVVDTPYFAITDEQGEVELADLPVGDYHVKTWHKALMTEQEMLQQTIKIDTKLQQITLVMQQDAAYFISADY